MSNLHLEILPPAQLAVWKELQNQASQLTQDGFYLAGGTALALHIGHRQSVDFDFFSETKNIGEKVFAWLQTLPDFIVQDQDSDTIHGQWQAVKLSFIGGYRYPLIEKLLAVDGLSLASIRDIGLMKLLAIINRATVRDYIDLAVIIRDHIPLAELVADVQKKYGDTFNTMLLLRTLVSFDDLDPEQPILLDKTLADSWQETLRAEVRKVAK